MPETETTAAWKGAAALAPFLMPVGDLHVHPRNPRQGEVAEIAASLKRFGQVRLVLASPDGTIIAGNHTYLAAVELGWPEVAAVVNEWASEEEARDYLLADNRLGDLGEYERQELILLLADLEATGRWDGTGYQADDLGHLRELEALANMPPPEPGELILPPPPPQLRELVLLYTEDQLGEVSANIRALRARYKTDDVTETILAAVQREAVRLNQGPAE